MSKIFLKLTIHHNRQQDENKYCSSRTPGHNPMFQIIRAFPKNLIEKWNNSEYLVTFGIGDSN